LNKFENNFIRSEVRLTVNGLTGSTNDRNIYRSQRIVRNRGRSRINDFQFGKKVIINGSKVRSVRRRRTGDGRRSNRFGRWRRWSSIWRRWKGGSLRSFRQRLWDSFDGDSLVYW
jgi:hypothetical protein